MSNALSETQQEFSSIVAALEVEPGVSLGAKGNKFGASTLQVNGKIFAMVTSKGSFVVKLPRQRVETLESTGTGQRFDPGHGRLMKEWLSLADGSTQQWLGLAREALQFVRRQS